MQVVLFNAVAMDRVSLRQLVKPINNEFDILKSTELTKNFLSDSWEQYLDVAIKILITMFAGKDRVVDLISDIANTGSDTGKNPYIDQVGSRFSAMIARRLNPKIKSGDTVYMTLGGQETTLKFEIAEWGPNLSMNNDSRIDAKTFFMILSTYIESGKYEKKHRNEYEFFD